MLALKSTRLSQGGASQIDWGNPITKGLVATYNNNFDSVGNRYFTDAYSPAQISINAKGVGISGTYAGTSFPGTTIKYVPLTVTGAVTIFAYASVANLIANSIVGLCQLIDGLSGIGIKTASSAPAYHRGLAYIASGNVKVATSSVLPSDKFCMLAVSWDGVNTIRFSIDGVEVATNNTVTALYLPTNFIIGGFATAGFSGDLNLAGVIAREVKGLALKQLAVNPLQIFR